MTNILENFGMRNLFLIIDLIYIYIYIYIYIMQFIQVMYNHDINRKFKMAAFNLHIEKGNFGILCKCCSHKYNPNNFIMGD